MISQPKYEVTCDQCLKSIKHHGGVTIQGSVYVSATDNSRGTEVVYSEEQERETTQLIEERDKAEEWASQPKQEKGETK